MTNAEQRNLALETVISLNDEDKYVPPYRRPTRGQRLKTRRAWYRFKIGNKPTSTMFPDGLCQPFFMVYGTWIVIIQVKFQNEEKSPFKTEGFFLKMSPTALCIFILVLGILFYAKNSLKYPNMIHTILTSVAYFSGILAHLSLVLVIFISPKFNWIRYLIISGPFVLVVAHTFRKSLGKKMCDIWERIKELKERKTSSPSTPISPV